MPSYIFGDSVGRDSVGRDQVGRDRIEQKGRHNTFTVNNSDGVSVDEFNAAIAELRDFAEHLRRTGVVTADGSVTDPVAVVQAVQSEPSRLKALTKAIASGAKGAVLSVVKDGVSALIVGLVGGQS